MANNALAKSKEPLRTPKGRLLYPHLFDKDKLQNKYTTFLVVDPETQGEALKAFKAALKKFADKSFEGEYQKGATFCVKDGDKWLKSKKKMPSEEIQEAVRGKTLIFAKSDYEPSVAVPDGGKLVTSRHRS